MVLRRRPRRRDHQQSGTLVTARPNLLAGEDLPAEPRQKRSLEKRARLMTASLACFGEKGYESTSIDEIARRANLAVGGFYQHFRSKRQLLLALMDELLEHLSRLDLRPAPGLGIQASLRQLLSRAFSTDLHYLGAYRAWQEAVLSDSGLAAKQAQIQIWTTARVTAVFRILAKLPGARREVDITGLARVMDHFFWSLLARAAYLPKRELTQWIDAATHLIYHAMFIDAQPAPAYTPSRPSSRTSRGAVPRSPSRGRRPQR